MIDCGRDWLGRLNRLAPSAILLTHAHPDHAFGLRDGAPCPVYGTLETLTRIRRFPIPDPRVIESTTAFRLGGLSIEAHPVAHSLLAPAVGYRIGRPSGPAVFYVPDVVSIEDPTRALRRVTLYIGDGASLRRSLIRQRGGRMIGHTSVRAQLDWCASYGIPRAIFTHCGSEIVTGEYRLVRRTIQEWGAERGIDAVVAFDGMTVGMS
jgi:phosphoribosyl 1,2-cyclic phosphodiesterase